MVTTFARLDGMHLARVEWEPVPQVEINYRPQKVSKDFSSLLFMFLIS